MSTTTTTKRLIAVAGPCAAVAGALYAGVQINHPPADLAHIVTTEWTIRMTAKVVFVSLALVGFAGMFLRHRSRFGRLGRAGYAILSVGFLAMLVQECLVGYYLPTIAHSRPVYVQHVLNGAMGHGATSGIGAWQGLFLICMGYSIGGLLFGIALFRAGVLSRAASALFAYGTVSALALSMLPESFDRPFAVPVGIALIGLGISLWRDGHRQAHTVGAPATMRVAQAATGKGHAPAPAGPGTWSGTAVPAGCQPRFTASPPSPPPHPHPAKSSTTPSTLMNTAPKTYAIRVDGHLDDHWSAWLGGSDMTRENDGTTTITALIADQTQLHGLLAGLRDIGAVITELRTTDTPVSATKPSQTLACSTR